MTDPLDRLAQLGAPDAVGARYNRPPKDRPTQPAGPRALRYAKIVNVTNDINEFNWYASAHRCRGDGTGVAGATIWLKATLSEDEPDPGDGVPVGFKNIEEGNVVAYVPADGKEIVETHAISGQIIAFGGPDGGKLYTVTLKELQPDFWAKITAIDHAPKYDFEEITGGRAGLALEENGNLTIEVGTVVRIFPSAEGDPTDWAFEFGGGGNYLLENAYETVEVWPALVITASASPLSARIWIPGGPVVPAVADDWYLSEDDETVNVEYDQVGDGTFAGWTLVPALRDYAAANGDPEVADWTMVRCIPAAVTIEDATLTTAAPDGVLDDFDITLVGVPLPWTLTVSYEVTPGVFRRLYMTRTVDADADFLVDLEGAGTGQCAVRTGLVTIHCDVPPMDGGAIKCRYVPFAACEWMAVTTFQSLEGAHGLPTIDENLNLGWIGVDAKARVAHGTPVGHRLGVCVKAKTDAGVLNWNISLDGGVNWLGWNVGEIRFDFDVCGHLQNATQGS